MDLAVVARRIQCGQGFGQKKKRKQSSDQYDISSSIINISV